MIQKPHLRPFYLLLLCVALCARQAHAITAADDINESLEISPSDETARWPNSGQSNNLAPNYTATISVTVVEEEEIDGVNYTLTSGPDVTTGCTDSNVIWTESGTTTYSITNTAADTASATMTLTCTWTPDEVAGGGNGSAPAAIPGQADAEIQLLDSVVDWEFDRHSQWADLSEEIGFEVTITDYNGFGLEEWSLTEFTPANATPQDPGWEIIPAAIPVGGSGWLLSASAFCETASKGNVKIKYNEGSEEERTSDDEIVFFEVDFITPAGDPVASPVDAGDDPDNIPDGANEFTFNDAATGVLTMKLKAQVTYLSSIPSSEQDMFGFELDGIGSSTFAWDSNNPGGKAKISGNYITATATYTGLPAENSDFGLKDCRVKYDDNENAVAEDDFEVFYMAKEKNHPGGDPAHPNWFHYYKKNEGGTDYTYDSSLIDSATLSGVPNSIRIANSAYDGGSYIKTTIINGQLKTINDERSEEFKYYRYFYSVVVHERHHANNELTLAASIPPLDSDKDSLSNTYETNVTKTDPSPPLGSYSASGIYRDDEVYAGGPIEEAANKAANTSQDWANPGTNSKQP